MFLFYVMRANSYSRKKLLLEIIRLKSKLDNPTNRMQKHSARFQTLPLCVFIVI